MKTTTAKRTHVRVRKGRGMQEGIVYVEVYLPFDPEAFGDFQTVLAKHGGDVAAAATASPELASKALEPVDLHGEAMLQGDVIDLAHRFLIQSRKMDVQHDRETRDSLQVVESFCNTPEIESPHWYPGAWVVAFKVDQASEEWGLIEDGVLDAVSFEALVVQLPVVITPTPES